MPEVDSRGSDSGAVLLTILETCQALKVSRGTVYRLLDSGQLRSLTIGKARRIRRTDLDEFIERRLAGAAS